MAKDQSKSKDSMDNRNSKNRGRRGRNRRGRDKEFELNVPDNDINAADLGIRGKASKNNDPSWYAKSEALLRDSASFPYSDPLGTSVNLYPHKNPNISVGQSFESIPGVMSLPFTPTVGKSTNGYSPINVASQALYNFVRKNNSGATNYEHADLMMYLLAMDSCYMMYSTLVRAYGIARLYSNYNRYLPNALLLAMGIDPDSVFQNLAQFRYGINALASKMGSMCVPAGMDYITRHSWMCSGIYADAPTVKAQCYVFVPRIVYVWNELETPARLNVYHWLNPLDTTAAGKKDVNTLLTQANQVLQSVILSQDFATMSGDIRKAFGEENLFMVAQIAEDYTVMPSYSQEVLSQIQNAYIVRPDYFQDSPITQDPSINSGAILQLNKLVGTGTTSLPLTEEIAAIDVHDRFINQMIDVVTPADTMVATRLTTAINSVAAVGSNYEWNIEYGTEILTGAQILTFEHTTGGAFTIVKRTFASDMHLQIIAGSDDQTVAEWLNSPNNHVVQNVQVIAEYSSFDWAPIVYVHVDVINDSRCVGMVCDANNYTTMNGDDLHRMNETAILSMFQVPQASFMVK